MEQIFGGIGMLRIFCQNYAKESDLWKKGTDTMDVWFDSGSSWAAVCELEVN